MKTGAMIVALVLASGSALAQAPELIGGASVIDGDTIEIHGERIRLFGIDAIEAHQTCTLPTGAKWRCGGAAAEALAVHLAKKPTSCAVRGTDRYNRSVAVCRTAEGDVNDWLVRNGWAMAYRAYSTDYVAAEVEASRAGLGIWAAQFEAPWQWRKAQRVSK
ncbi:MAG: Succinoglycan biosynthesis protein [uncultured bacterium]|nr:MAG: Succinoglycan biosynthesis protein [uncultured bacterium]